MGAFAVWNAGIRERTERETHIDGSIRGLVGGVVAQALQLVHGACPLVAVYVAAEGDVHVIQIEQLLRGSPPICCDFVAAGDRPRRPKLGGIVGPVEVNCIGFARCGSGFKSRL
jgi:hypothetical protein